MQPISERAYLVAKAISELQRARRYRELGEDAHWRASVERHLQGTPDVLAFLEQRAYHCDREAQRWARYALEDAAAAHTLPSS